MMRKILVIGAGKSTSYLIDYLLEKSEAEKLQVTIGDINPSAVSAHIADHKQCSVVPLDIMNEEERGAAISKSDIVISMLPASMHIKVAEDCLQFKKHLVTASYISPALQSLNEKVKKNGLIFMNEIGLDPGIDHMSAMQVIDRIRDQGGRIILFESFCGGLVAPEDDNNLWNYKFTWNP
ncbi:MAG: saccharopine dehydrogenase C-terminal domain-containing protein, partial [Maribacter sp.]